MTKASISWAVLLARWTEFAQASVALPDNVTGDQWRASVAPIIELQSVTYALSELDEIDDEDRPSALDRAEVICKKASKALYRVWDNEPPSDVEDIIDDARAMFEAASNAGLEWCAAGDGFVSQPFESLLGRLADLGFKGDLFAPLPGHRLLAGTPVAFARAPGGAAPARQMQRVVDKFLATCGGGGEARRSCPRQVYRRHDFATGGLQADLVMAMSEPPIAGQPLLVLAMESGDMTSPTMPGRQMTHAGKGAVPPGVEFAGEQGGDDLGSGTEADR